MEVRVAEVRSAATGAVCFGAAGRLAGGGGGADGAELALEDEQEAPCECSRWAAGKFAVLSVER